MQGINVQGGFDWQSLQPYLCYVPGDLQEDLFYLKAKIFPQLDALCQTRGTCFRPMDLQQSEDVSNDHINNPNLLDQRLKICLDLIDRSSFFICLLGQSYGQCLPDIEPCSLSEVTRNLKVAANSGHPWVVKDDYRTCSLTELEITKAAFIDNHRNCFFYFKDYTPRDSDDDGSEEMCIFLDMLSKQSQSERQRMRHLKRRIINNCLPVRFFRNLYELGEMMRMDWEEVIFKIAEDPKIFVSGWQDSFEHHYHESYSRALCNWLVPSVPTTEILTAFNEFLHPITKNAQSEMHARNPGDHFTSDLDLNDSGRSILLVSGERGCGKSTLAAWCLQAFYKQNPYLPVIYHFCGISTSSTDIRSLLRLCTAQLRRAHYGDPADWDESLEDTSEFEYLHRAVQTFTAAVNLRPCILLIDGIDLLTETLGLSKQEVKALQWLPAALPPYCKIIITTTFTDLTYKSLTSRTDVQILKCPHFSDPSVQRSILLKHLSLPYKDPPNRVLQRMVRRCRSPAVLALVGTELRTCGVLREEEEEMELLKEYVEADSVPELWVKVIHRWVKDYSRSAPSEDITSCTHTSLRKDLSGWVWDMLCLIHVSHAGLAESQVLALLEDLGYCGHLRVQVLEWARLRSAIWPWIQEKANGLLIIMHQSLSQAMNLLLHGTEGQNSYHRILATFFQKSSFEICNWIQKMEEIPWHLKQTSSFKELHDFLVDPETMEFLSSNLKHYPQLTVDVIHYWTLLRKRGFDPVTLTQICEHLKDHSHLSSLSLFCSKVLLYLGEMRKAEELLLRADKILQKAVELDSDSMRLLLNVQHMLAELYVQMHLPKDMEIYCHKGFETAQSCLDSAEVKLIVGQLLCRLCVAMLEEGRLFEMPGLFKKIPSASYISAHPCAEGTVMLLKAIHKLSLGELKIAERCFQSALASRRRWYGHDHPLVAVVEELLADLWDNAQTNTEWTQRKMVELYRHVISTKETEAQTSQLPIVQHGLAVILMKLGEVLLRSCSKVKRREGLDLLQRAADLQIRLLGSEHPMTRNLDQFENIEIQSDCGPAVAQLSADMSDYSRVIHHATSILCSNKGSMEISQLHRRVFQRFEVSEEHFGFIVKECARFAVVQSRPRAAGEESDCIVVAKTSLRLCKKYFNNECYDCQDLHLCKYFVYGNCRYGKGRKECKFSHNIQSQHNYPRLRECTLHELNEDDLFLLLLQNDPALLPEVCAHYNKGMGVFGACTFMERCTKVHICQHFVQDSCLFGPKCKRHHSIDEHSHRMLEGRELGADIIHDLPYIYQNVYRLNSQALSSELIPGQGIKPVAQMEKDEICLHFIRRKCRFQDQCVLVHFNLPYKWEVHDRKDWRDLRNMEEIERAYCDPKNEHSPGSRPVNFVSMTRNCDPVRRLSTVSSVSKPIHYVLTTEWIWYYKGDHENWIEYGQPDDKQRVTSVTSRDLEKAFQEDNNAEITVIKGNRHYYVSFQDMYQRNPKHNTKRRVRRRPRFVSISEVETKAAQ